MINQLNKQLNALQETQSKPDWASNLDKPACKTICALHRAAKGLDINQHIDTMDTGELEHYKKVYQVSKAPNYKWVKSKVQRLLINGFFKKKAIVKE